MRTISALTADRAKQFFDYDPTTGIFTRKESLHVRYLGKTAGNINNNGHLALWIDGKSYLAHRVAWLISYGEWPENEVDHINRVRTDNRLCNLRAATRAQNSRNQSVKPNNTSGFKGIWLLPSGRWRARIRFEGKPIYLGIFDTAELAHAAYARAAAIYFGEFANAGGDPGKHDSPNEYRFGYMQGRGAA